MIKVKSENAVTIITPPPESAPLPIAVIRMKASSRDDDAAASKAIPLPGPEKSIRSLEVDASMEWRRANPEKYKTYMRDYMRRRRAKEKGEMK